MKRNQIDSIVIVIIIILFSVCWFLVSRLWTKRSGWEWIKKGTIVSSFTRGGGGHAILGDCGRFYSFTHLKKKKKQFDENCKYREKKIYLENGLSGHHLQCRATRFWDTNKCIHFSLVRYSINRQSENQEKEMEVRNK